METSAKPSNMNIGRKISRIRELKNIKQEYLASELGLSQQTVSRMEQSETVENEVLEKVAAVLGVTAEAIKNFSDEAVINYFNTFNDSSGAGACSNRAPSILIPLINSLNFSRKTKGFMNGCCKANGKRLNC